MADAVTAIRHRIGGVGVWLGALREALAHDERRVAGRIEELGYGSLWIGERIGGKEAFAHSGLLLNATAQLVVGTGIANIWSRRPAVMIEGAASLSTSHPGRFMLGVGVSHAEMVERSGQSYTSPLTHMTSYLEAMNAQYQIWPDHIAPVPRLVGALGPRMIQLAREKSDGVHSYFVPPSHTYKARAILGGDKLLIPEQAVVVTSSPSTGRSVARDYMKLYLRLPNYLNSLNRLGYGDTDISAGGSSRLVDSIVAWGEPEDIARRIEEHLMAGANHVVVQPLGDLASAMSQLECLAETFRDLGWIRGAD